MCWWTLVSPKQTHNRESHFFEYLVCPLFHDISKTKLGKSPPYPRSDGLPTCRWLWFNRRAKKVWQPASVTPASPSPLVKNITRPKPSCLRQPLLDNFSFAFSILTSNYLSLQNRKQLFPTMLPLFVYLLHSTVTLAAPQSGFLIHINHKYARSDSSIFEVNIELFLVFYHLSRPADFILLHSWRNVQCIPIHVSSCREW